MVRERRSRSTRAKDGVVVGLSGGVDSATALWLLCERGYRALGVTLRMQEAAHAGARGAPCCGDEAIDAAADLCRRIGVPHRVVDVRRRFADIVVAPFIDEYRRGRTPNPCVVCNEKLKFPVLAEEADRLGVPLIATGHHARIVRAARGRVLLARGADGEKDQSYFLYRVPVGLLARALMPVGEMSKREVRAIAASRGLAGLHARESQDVCFLSSGGLVPFLDRFIEPREGDTVDSAGRFLGRHAGAWRYTVGQRRGIGIAAGEPLYVKRVDTARNRVVVAPESELYERIVFCRAVKLRSRSLRPPLEAKIRYRHIAVPILRLSRAAGGMTVVFREPQRSPTPGQSLVLYRDGVVMGGGMIAGAGEGMER